MSTAADSQGPRVPPNGDAWRDAQKKVSDRNDEARRAGKAERAAYDRKVAERRRAADERNGVYR